MTSKSNSIGRIGEMLALKLLEAKGFTLITKNYRIRGGEVDIIVEKNGILVFVEVKTRTTDKFGRPEEGLTIKKKRYLLRTIQHYLYKNGIRKWRCDLVAIKIERRTAYLNHIINIFQE